MGRRNGTSRFLDGIQRVEFYTSETELLFNFRKRGQETPLSSLLGSLLKISTEGHNRAPFLIILAKYELRFTNWSAKGSSQARWPLESWFSRTDTVTYMPRGPTPAVGSHTSSHTKASFRI